MNILSVVVSRKGSKGLKDKGVRVINGKYAFTYVADYSLHLADFIPEVYTVISSDSEIIEDYCVKQQIPFLKRPPELASDTARLEDVLYDVYKKAGKEFDYISLLYGNIPTRYPDEFVRAYKFLETHPDYEAVLSMQNVEKYNPAWMFELNDTILPQKMLEGFRRQGLKQYTIHDGHTILLRSRHFLSFMEGKKETTIMYEPFGRKIKPMLNNKVIIDVDTQKDLSLAEAILKSNLCR